MIRTRQQSAISRIWHNINQSWGVAVGFLMLLFIIPFAIIVSDTSHQNLTNSNADSSKPLVLISPQSGQGLKNQFTAEVRDTNVDQLESVDVWFGVNPPDINQQTGNFATISFQNYAPGSFDWRANIYNRRTDGVVTNINNFKADDNAASGLSKIYSTPSSKLGEINLSSTDSSRASASIKFRKVQKFSDNILRFYIDVEFKNNFSDKNINMFMKAKRSLAYGGATSSTSTSEWTNVGNWIVASATARPSVSSNQPPKFNSIPPSKVTIGQLYKYTILATDPENDPLKYEIYSNPAPAFLKLDGNVLSGTPKSSDKGPQSIVISVTDSVGNQSTQSWTINVVDAAQPQVPTVTITSPKANDQLSGKANVSWTVSSTTGVNSLRLSYAPLNSTSFKIITSPSTSDTSYSWDTSALTNGKYILKLEALNPSGTAIAAATTESFDVNNAPNTSNIQSPKLVGRTPEEGVITDTKPRIAATVNAGSSDPDMNTLVVKLDGDDITSKIDKGANSFSYTPLTDLAYGNHEISVSVKGKDAVGDAGLLNEKWTFTIDNKLPGTTNTGSTEITNKIKLPVIGITVDQWLGTLIIGLFVLILFAILVIAVIALIRVLKGKDDDMEQISRYYQKDAAPTPVNPNALDSNVNSGMTPDPFSPATTAAVIPPSQEYSTESLAASTTPTTTSETAYTAPVTDTQTFQQTSASVDTSPYNVQQPVQDYSLPQQDVTSQTMPTDYSQNYSQTTPTYDNQDVTFNPEQSNQQNNPGAAASSTASEPYDPFK